MPLHPYHFRERNGPDNRIIMARGEKDAWWKLQKMMDRDIALFEQKHGKIAVGERWPTAHQKFELVSSARELWEGPRRWV